MIFWTIFQLYKPFRPYSSSSLKGEKLNTIFYATICGEFKTIFIFDPQPLERGHIGPGRHPQNDESSITFEKLFKF